MRRQVKSQNSSARIGHLRLASSNDKEHQQQTNKTKTKEEKGNTWTPAK